MWSSLLTYGVPPGAVDLLRVEAGVADGVRGEDESVGAERRAQPAVHAVQVRVALRRVRLTSAAPALANTTPWNTSSKGIGE